MPDYRAYAREAATRHRIDAGIFERQIQQESGFDPDAFNAGSGATGIAQIVRRWHPDVDPTDPIASLDYAAALMASHITTYGGWRRALAAYNWGPGNLAASGWDGQSISEGRIRLPLETIRYLDAILGTGWPEPGAATMPPQTIVYNPETPPERQVQDWACSIRAATWVLKSLGVNIDAGTLQGEMVPSVVTPEDGLLDARGYGLAQILQNHLPAGYTDRIRVLESVTFDDVAAIAGTGPIALGGRAWYHWVAVRKPIDANTLAIANPAPGYKGVGDTLSRQQFSSLGPFSAVWVDARAETSAPDWTLASPDVGPGLLELMRADGTAPASHSTFLPLGRSPALIEEAYGLNGTRYAWHLPTGQSWRYPAA